MEAITFYSYKGGVGRSLALTNIAQYLARFEFNVCILDFDLEAPGLHYKFEKVMPEQKPKMGLVNYISSYYLERKLISIKDIATRLNKPKGSKGTVHLITAGEIGFDNNLGPGYLETLSSIAWDDLLYSEKHQGALFFMNLKAQIEEELKPDFLLIDSRTGVTEIGGICTTLLADKVVYLLTNNQENFAGTQMIYENVRQRSIELGRKEKKSVFVLTRIPFEKDRGKEQKIRETFWEFLEVPPEENKLYTIHSNRELEFGEYIAMRLEDTSAQQAQLVTDYIQLFSGVIDSEVLEPQMGVIIQNILDGLIDDPDKTQKELENLVQRFPFPANIEALIDLYVVRNVDRDRLLEEMHRLWEVKGEFSNRNSRIYAKQFMNIDASEKSQVLKFNLEILDDYFSRLEGGDLDYGDQLLIAYFSLDMFEQAIALSQVIIELDPERIRPYGATLAGYLEQNDYEHAKQFYLNYKPKIDSSPSLLNFYLKALENKEYIKGMEEIIGQISDQDLSLLVRKKPESGYYLVNHGKKALVSKAYWDSLKEKVEVGDDKGVQSMGDHYRDAQLLDQYKLDLQKAGYEDWETMVERAELPF